MDSLPAIVGRHTNIRLSNADTFYVSMIGGDHNFKVAIEQSVQEAPQRTPLGPMTDPGMHAIGAGDDAVQHLIDCPDHDACDRAARLVEFPANSAGFLTQMCARFSPSRSAAPWEEGADALVPANQR